MASQYRYRGNPEWRVGHEEGFLVLNGGADHLYAVEDVPAEVADELAALWDRAAGADALSDAAARLVPQLLSADVLRRELAPGPPARVAVAFAGRPSQPLLDALVAEAEDGRRWALSDPPRAELTLVVRTGGRLVELCDGRHH